MNNAVYIALSRQTGLFRNMEVIANNIANASTPGFKEDALLFDDYLVNDRDNFQRQIAFAHDGKMATNFKDGVITTTGRPLDVALEGEGFFRVETPGGVRYTRGGNFSLNGNREIVTENGDRVLDVAGAPIKLLEEDINISISADGTIQVDQEGQRRGDSQLRGQISVVTFDNLQKVEKQGNGLFVTDQAEIPSEAKVLQGVSEQSNVNSVVQITQMIEVNRSTASVSRFMSEMHELMRRAITAYTRAA